MPDDFVVAVASGKGGTGKTTIAANLAWVVCKSGRKVQYLDCDVGAADLHLPLDPDIKQTHDFSGGKLAAVVSEKCITFCRQLDLPVLGVIENMSGFVCPHCNQKIDVFAGEGGEEMAGDFKVPFLGRIPIDPAFAGACDSGETFVAFNRQNSAAQAISKTFEPLLEAGYNV